ncbi:enoyl-CoA hydratase/isomerase family protein [Kyrpidia tusciae]|uniref:Enoyl-CoA hydratase/isomerase n=1 Tax=Kyrpidia tusciae (strain DSM 2912 / NBRC 15312 / T2) TaxID=562970 RepID=D5WSI6_KYRT2|nr:enoyl-CoA hydratase-related protein [Kyrpidia tusciae]ADG07005.1 Enoyl-CoA hydratase/isomerase [Kyrpidia tusciae DSM 2912]
MKTIVWEVNQGIGRLTLNRPEVRNALNGEMFEEIQQVLAEARERDEVRVLVLTGAGPVFCAGGDLREIQGLGPLGTRRLLNEKVRPLIQSLMLLDKPVIASLNGPVAGAGIGVVLACDLVLASQDASFIPAFGKIGAMPDAAMIYFLVQHIGPKRIKELIFRGEPLSADQAYSWGVYNRVVDRAMLEGLTAEWAEELATGPTLAMGLAKRAVRDALRMPFDAFMDLESASQSLLHVSFDHREGIAAFLEKRRPEFQGT